MSNQPLRSYNESDETKKLRLYIESDENLQKCNIIEMMKSFLSLEEGQKTFFKVYKKDFDVSGTIFTYKSFLPYELRKQVNMFNFELTRERDKYMDSDKPHVLIFGNKNHFTSVLIDGSKSVFFDPNYNNNFYEKLDDIYMDEIKNVFHITNDVVYNQTCQFEPFKGDTFCQTWSLILAAKGKDYKPAKTQDKRLQCILDVYIRLSKEPEYKVFVEKNICNYTMCATNHYSLLQYDVDELRPKKEMKVSDFLNIDMTLKDFILTPYESYIEYKREYLIPLEKELRIIRDVA